jgi:glutamate racemase
MIESDIDYLVLGCSHYPYLIPQLRKILPTHIKILHSGKAIAQHTKRTLIATKLLQDQITTPSLEFYTNTKTSTLHYLLENYSQNISVQFKEF